MVPSAFILLNIYQFVNLHVTSWGTRETKAQKLETEKGPNHVLDRKYTNRTVNLGNLCYFQCCPSEADFIKYSDMVAEDNKDDSKLSPPIKGGLSENNEWLRKKYKISVLGLNLTLITNLQSDFLVDVEKPKSANFLISIFWSFTKGPPV